MGKRKLIFVVSLIMSCISIDFSYAQDPTFTQFYSNPMYLNPAFAGTANCPKLHLNVRDQWPNIPGSFVTTSFSLDQNIPSINSGYGIQAVYDRAGEGILNYTQVSGIYAYNLKINKKFSVSGGAQVTFNHKFLDKEKLIFSDQITTSGGVTNQSAELANINGNATFVDFGLGLIVFSERYFLGASFHHINKPSDTFFSTYSVSGVVVEGVSQVPVKTTVHGGANIPTNGNVRKGIIGDSPYITAGFIYQTQGAADQLNLGLSLTNKSLSGGVWYRVNSENSDAVMMVLGYEVDQYIIGYSYDYTVSELSNATGGAHELSLRIQLPCKVKPKKLEPIRCPKF